MLLKQMVSWLPKWERSVTLFPALFLPLCHVVVVCLFIYLFEEETMAQIGGEGMLDTNGV